MKRERELRVGVRKDLKVEEKQRGPLASPCLETNVVRLTEITAKRTCQGKLAQYGF